MLQVFLPPLLFLLTSSLTGARPPKPKEIYVKAGEMVTMLCPLSHSDTELAWIGYTLGEMVLLSDMSSAKQRQMGILVHGGSLVIFNASLNHQGNYSCSVGNASSQCWFRLTVYTTQSPKNEERNKRTMICYTQESCTLNCPNLNIPDVNTLNISSLVNIIWHKENESLPNDGYFSSVEKKDEGVYTCTRSYLYHGQIYNVTFTVVLQVELKVLRKTEAITSPYDNDVFDVDLGSTLVIDCKAVVYSEFDDLFWLSGTSFVEMNDSLPVFYNISRENDTEETRITASLVFKKVSQEHLSRPYTCKLDSPSQPSPYVTISLALKARPSYVSLTVVVVCLVVAASVTVVIYVKFKIDLILFVRHTLGCHRSPSDGKIYDAFLLHYNSDTDAGLKDCDRKWLESVLETSYGYSLCLWERDVLPGGAEAEEVLECIEKSRTVVLVPTSSDSGPESGLLSAIHSALVERQSHLVFIKTEATKAPTSGSLPEALQFLGEAGDYVTWKGMRSMTSSSSFFKQLRYYLPVPQDPPELSP